jgi:hypothetical protein
MNAKSAESPGMLLGLIGVIAFSLTLPATRAAVASLDPLFVSSGRAVVDAMTISFALLVFVVVAFGRRLSVTKSVN